MQKLLGKVALITGAAGGLGEATARHFVAEGARVAVAARQAEPGARLAAELGKNATFVELDVTDPAQWARATSQVGDKFGPVTVLVNNAAYGGPTVQLADLDPEEYEKVIATSQTGPFLGMRAVLPGMVRAGGGSIVNISSVAGFIYEPYFRSPAYAAAKFGVRGLTKAAAVEYGPLGIRVNTVCPGGTLTPRMLTHLTPEMRQATASTLPLRRMAEPREITSVIVFLAGDESSFVTGADYVVDGGQIID